MAEYEYKCTRCDSEFDECHKMGEAPGKTKCPDCGAESARKYATTAIRVEGGSSPARYSGTSSIAEHEGVQPTVAAGQGIDLGGGVKAVPRLDKRGKPVRQSDIKSKSDLPRDLQKLHDKKREKSARERERHNPNRSQI